MTITTEIGYTTRESISIRGLDLVNDILGKFDFVDMICWVNLGRLPTPSEKEMLNLLLVVSVDHGLTPSAISTRMTYHGAPESLQGAVAAGLLGAGSRYLGTVQNVASMLREGAAILANDADDRLVRESVVRTVQAYRAQGRTIPGVGHPIHSREDPRVSVLRAAARRNGCFGLHWRFVSMIPEVLRDEHKKNLPLNGAGAVGAIMADMGMDPLFGKGLTLISRTAGLLAHAIEEAKAPTGQDIWDLVLAQDERNELS